MGDETYLESFIEQIQTLPSEMRRNLELMKDLDKSCSALSTELRQAQEEYIAKAQARILQLEVGLTPEGKPGVKVISSSNSDGNNNDNNDHNDEKTTKKKRNKRSSADVVDDDDPSSDFIIPTTEELTAYAFPNSNKRSSSASSSSNLLKKIRIMEVNALQQAEEKVAIANQTYSLVESTVKRLDRDLNKLETMLKTSGEFRVAGSAKPNDLAAINVIPQNSTDWILAKVLSHDIETGMYRLSDEDVESNKIFHLPEAQVVVLNNGTTTATNTSNRNSNSNNAALKFNRGDIVYAVYPDTTSFYQARVVQPPTNASTSGGRRGSSSAASSAAGGLAAGEPFVMVNFVDDADENGITHDKAVLLKHVMKVPYGATIQPM